MNINQHTNESKFIQDLTYIVIEIPIFIYLLPYFIQLSSFLQVGDSKIIRAMHTLFLSLTLSLIPDH